MKTTDLFKINRTSKRLNESMFKTFGRKLNLETFNVEQLEDARNKLRTQIYTARSSSGFNETVENDALSQAQFMHDAIVAELSERDEPIVDNTVQEGADIDKQALMMILKNFDENMNERGGYGDPDYNKVLAALNQGDVESAVEEVYYAYSDQDGGEIDMADYLEDLEDQFKDMVGGTEDNTSRIQGESMSNLREGEIQQASAIVTAKTMVDRVGRWIEELSGMENDTLLQLGDSIRDEMGQEQAKGFIEAVAPAIQSALENLKTTREALATGVRTLTGEEQPVNMLGGEPAADMAAEPDAMNADAELGGDEFAAAEPAAGGAEEAGREMRESINHQNRLMRALAG
jgi:hypothetical protein